MIMGISSFVPLFYAKECITSSATCSLRADCPTIAQHFLEILVFPTMSLYFDTQSSDPEVSFELTQRHSVRIY